MKIDLDSSLQNNATKFDGVLRKQMDVSRLVALGGHVSLGLGDGFSDAYQWLVNNPEAHRL